MRQKHLFPLIRRKTLALLNDYVQAREITEDIDSYIAEPGLGIQSAPWERCSWPGRHMYDPCQYRKKTKTNPKHSGADIKKCPLHCSFLSFFNICNMFEQDTDATKTSKADQIMAKNDAKFIGTDTNPIDISLRGKTAWLQGIVTSPKKRKKWHLYVPDFQVFVQRASF